MPRPARRTRQQVPAVFPKEPLAREIARILRDEGLTQTEAGYRTRKSPTVLSLVTNGKLKGFSHENLLGMLAALGRDVEIRIRPSAQSSGKVRLRIT